MKILSCIIPSYNSAKYLDICIPSLLGCSDAEKLDVIIVNDGSTDDTKAVAEKYCMMYPEIVRLINQENKGHGGALNTGCAAAKGKYLKVIDADDWVDTKSMSSFLDFLETCESHVVLTHYYTEDVSTQEIKEWKIVSRDFGKPLTFEQIMPEWKGFLSCLTFHGITYNTRFYQSHNYKLSEHVFYEDHEFSTFPCCYAESITPLDMFIYHYRIGDMQQSVSDANQLRRVFHTETVLERFLSEYEYLPFPEESCEKAFVAAKAQILLLSYLSTVMLVEKNKKRGRGQAAVMVEKFKKKMPPVYTSVQKKYIILCVLNRLHVSKKTFEKLLHSGIYRRLAGK